MCKTLLTRLVNIQFKSIQFNIISLLFGIGGRKKTSCVTIKSQVISPLSHIPLPSKQEHILSLPHRSEWNISFNTYIKKHCSRYNRRKSMNSEKGNLHYISGFFLCISSLVLSTSVIPEALKTAKITKKHLKPAVQHYWVTTAPYPSFPFFSKLLGIIIHVRIINYLEKFRLLSLNQCEFSAAFSANTIIPTFTDKIWQHIDSGNIAAGALFDFSKAFDTLNRNIVTAKLSSFGIESNALSFLRYYLYEASNPP